MNDYTTLEQANAAKSSVIEKIGKENIVGIAIRRVDGGYGLKVNLSNPVVCPAEIDGVSMLWQVGV